MSFNLLKERLLIRLEKMGIKVLDIHEEVRLKDFCFLKRLEGVGGGEDVADALKCVKKFRIHCVNMEFNFL